jgi:hypothetical protein
VKRFASLLAGNKDQESNKDIQEVKSVAFAAPKLQSDPVAMP